MGRKIFLVIAIIAVAALILINVSIKEANPTSAPVPRTIIPPVAASQITTLDSPDASKTIVMKKVKHGSEIIYSFNVSGREIFSKAVDNSVTFLIPQNAWSPDSKYVFLKETGNAGSVFFVLSVLSDSSAQNDQTANITNLFATKYPDLKIEDVTGWGGINLVVVNSLKSDGSQGLSYWFEMPGHAFIQLANHF